MIPYPRLKWGQHAVPLPIFLIILLLVFLPACGKKGPIRPLLKAEPSAPGRPEVRQIGGEILLLLDLPVTNLDGSPLTDLTELRVYRRETAGGVCSACDEPTELWQTIDLLTARLDGQRLTIRDADVRLGYGYRYRLVPVTSRGLSGASAGLARELHPFPSAPQEFTGTGFDRMVLLQWVPSSDLAPGWNSLGCQIFRSSGDTLFGMSPLTSAPIQGGRFEDLGPVNGILYRYQLRCLAGQGEAIVESPSSSTVSVTPQPQ